MKKLVVLLLCLLFLVSVFAGCTGSVADSDVQDGTSEESVETEESAQAEEDSDNGAESQDEPQVEDPTETAHKIGVIIYDPTDSEVVAFQKYYVDYIAPAFNVEFIYSEACMTAEQEVTALENFFNQGCEGVISFFTTDEAMAVEMCADAGVYYIIGAAGIDDDLYEQLKDNEYYLGSVGVSFDGEEIAGYEMAKHFIDQGYTNYLFYGGGITLGVEMHILRTEGMLRAFEEIGATTEGDDIIERLESIQLDGYTFNYLEGFPIGDTNAFFGQVSQKLSTPDLEVVIGASMVLEIFGATIAQMELDLQTGSIAAYTETYQAGYNADPQQMNYIAGKFNACIGPAFAAMYSAVSGQSIRLEDGSAIRVEQPFWISTSTDEFNERYEVANSLTNPAYSIEELKSVLPVFNPDADYSTFEALAAAASYQEALDRIETR